ncbi:hypothetical protein GCM10027563_18720 [Parasphingorhabdus pacifica]
MAVVGWLVAAGFAAAVGLVAVSALGREILDAKPPMTSPSEVEAELARPAPVPPGRDGPDDSPAGTQPQLHRTSGGTVVVACYAAEETASLRSWSPAQGFRVDDVEDGPAEQVELTFESEEVEVEVSARCRSSEPLVSTVVDR